MSNLKDKENKNLESEVEGEGTYNKLIQKRNSQAQIILGKHQIIIITCDPKEKMYNFFYLVGNDIVLGKVSTEGQENGSEFIYPFLGRKTHFAKINYKSIGSSCVIVEEITFEDTTYKVIKELYISERDMLCIFI